MNYKRAYDDLIKRRQLHPLPADQYGERHHIVPRCLGGSNRKDNLVRLTAREHAICHLLLAKLHPTNPGLNMAAYSMLKEAGTSRLYERLRLKGVEAGRTPEARAKMSAFARDRVRSPEHRAKLVAILHSPAAKATRDATYARMAEKRRQREEAEARSRQLRAEERALRASRWKPKLSRSEAQKLAQNRPEVREKIASSLRGRKRTFTAEHRASRAKRPPAAKTDLLVF